MKEILKKAEQAYIMEFIIMGAALYIYQPTSNLHWIVIAIGDSYMISRLDIVSVVKCSLLPEYKKESIRIMILEGLFLICLVIVWFKQPTLVWILLINDIFVEFISFFKHFNGKKTQ